MDWQSLKAENILISLLLFIHFCTLAQNEIRYALVIGNKDYPKDIGSLNNPINDAQAMAEELRKTNFSVQLLLNASYEETREAVKLFYSKLDEGPRDSVVGLFYYAGHGLQYQGENYIVPIDAKIQYEDDIVRTCFPIQRMVLSHMELAKTRMNILILDACRNNPFPSKFRSLNTKGLAEMNAGFGSFIAYATAPGAVASDGMEKNGLYTQELLKAMKIPGLLIEQVFKEVRRNVLRLSGETQYTWDSSNIIGDFYFIPSDNILLAEKKSVEPTDPKNETVETSRTVRKKVIEENSLAQELSSLTDPSIPFNQRQAKRKTILGHFVVPYATVYILIGDRIDERLTASKLMDRIVTLPKANVKVVDMETSDSGRIVELAIEIKE